MKLDIELKRLVGKGLCVFATKNFRQGEIIESCPVLILSPDERKHCEKTVLNHYIYPWRSTRSASVVFGYGSIINHSFYPNADWKQDFRSTRMVYRAIRPIKKGEEITVNYNGEPDDLSTKDLWFEVKP